ncbi:MAG: MerR family transcriptional regulator [bacterium]
MLETSNNGELPEIPDKRYFTIGETSDLCGVKSHVLRYWEQEFPMLKPMKRRGNRRYYQHNDVLLVRKIRSLLYDQGYTIGGARQKLLDGDNFDRLPPDDEQLQPPASETLTVSALKAELTAELEAMLKILDS